MVKHIKLLNMTVLVVQLIIFILKEIYLLGKYEYKSVCWEIYGDNSTLRRLH